MLSFRDIIATSDAIIIITMIDAARRRHYIVTNSATPVVFAIGAAMLMALFSASLRYLLLRAAARDISSRYAIIIATISMAFSLADIAAFAACYVDAEVDLMLALLLRCR